jgi:hypothetical protein
MEGPALTVLYSPEFGFRDHEIDNNSVALRYCMNAALSFGACNNPAPG